MQFPTKTPELYADKVAPLVDSAMKGFNSTVFAYGQTGSGKSHTMSGTADELGIIPCAVDGVFDAITGDTDRAFLLRVSYIEIYNETLRDLLNLKKGPLADNEKPVIHTRTVSTILPTYVLTRSRAKLLLSHWWRRLCPRRRMWSSC